MSKVVVVLVLLRIVAATSFAHGELVGIFFRDLCNNALQFSLGSGFRDRIFFVRIVTLSFLVLVRRRGFGHLIGVFIRGGRRGASRGCRLGGHIATRFSLACPFHDSFVILSAFHLLVLAVPLSARPHPPLAARLLAEAALVDAGVEQTPHVLGGGTGAGPHIGYQGGGEGHQCPARPCGKEGRPQSQAPRQASRGGAREVGGGGLPSSLAAVAAPVVVFVAVVFVEVTVLVFVVVVLVLAVRVVVVAR
mmetsp:Transcript_36085/g.107954  ORF Transcript_36085/g.107954 Transcript_36085/m.107954 type:complete len:249 (-) Transcript_36085:983-1729(-)